MAPSSSQSVFLDVGGGQLGPHRAALSACGPPTRSASGRTSSRMMLMRGSSLLLLVLNDLTHVVQALDRRGRRGGRKDLDPYNIQQEMLQQEEQQAQKQAASAGAEDQLDRDTLDDEAVAKVAEELKAQIETELRKQMKDNLGANGKTGSSEAGPGEDETAYEDGVENNNFLEEENENDLSGNTSASEGSTTVRTDKNNKHRQRLQDDAGQNNGAGAGAAAEPDGPDPELVNGAIFVALLCVFIGYAMLNNGNAANGAQRLGSAAGAAGGGASGAQRNHASSSGKNLPNNNTQQDHAAAIREQRLKRFQQQEQASASAGGVELQGSHQQNVVATTGTSKSANNPEAPAQSPPSRKGADNVLKPAPPASRGGATATAEKAKDIQLKSTAGEESQRPEVKKEEAKKLQPVAPVDTNPVVSVSEKAPAKPRAASSPERPAGVLDHVKQPSVKEKATKKPLKIFVTCNSQLSKAVAELSPVENFQETPFEFQDRDTATVGMLKEKLFERVIPAEFSAEDEQNILRLAGFPPEGGAGGAATTSATGSPTSEVVPATKKLCLLFRGRILQQDDKLLVDSGFGKFGEDRVMFMYR